MALLPRHLISTVATDIIMAPTADDQRPANGCRMAEFICYRRYWALQLVENCLGAAVKRNRENEPITIERLEAALGIVARAILLDGPIYAPIFDRLEREIAALRANDDVVSRAQRFLAAYSAADSGNKVTEGVR